MLVARKTPLSKSSNIKIKAISVTDNSSKNPNKCAYTHTESFQKFAQYFAT